MAESPVKKIVIEEAPPEVPPEAPPEAPPRKLPDIRVERLYISLSKTYVYSGEAVRATVTAYLEKKPFEAKYSLPVYVYADGSKIGEGKIVFPIGSDRQKKDFKLTLYCPPGRHEITYKVYAETPDYAKPVV
ncbi:hypothetical protein J7L81_02700 [Candidatus Aerophobetes bacterium]|nr:hypothetical protein [Candidatus Aerophobetes bacterium]